jgi:hypothetical protein
MTGEYLNVLATALAAVAALAALVVAVLSLLQSKRQAESERRQTARAMDDSLQSRLNPMYPELRRTLGHMQDGVPHEIRQVLIPFFVLYSDAYGAYRDGLVDTRDWVGFAQELAYWAQKPISRRAWSQFRKQVWTEGFSDFVDGILSGPPAYPEVPEVMTPSLAEWLAAEVDGGQPFRRTTSNEP